MVCRKSKGGKKMQVTSNMSKWKVESVLGKKKNNIVVCKVKAIVKHVRARTTAYKW